MGCPLRDQDSAVGSQYRKLVNHNVTQETGRIGERRRQRDREQQGVGMKRVYKASL